MRTFQRISKFCAAITFVLCASLGNFYPAFAEDGAQDYGLEMSPAVIELGDLNPGDMAEGKFSIKNTGKEPTDFKITFEPYGVTGEDYTADLETRTQYNDIIDWATFSANSGSLEAGESREIQFFIKVPKDVPAGGQYGTIVAESSAKNDSSSSSIAIGRRVGIVVYTQVAGDTRKTGSIEDLKLPSILFNPPVTATSIVENTGNTHAVATYTLQVFPLFSDEEVYTNEEDPDELVILPETRRFNTISWEGAPHLGIFRVKQTVKLFDQTEEVEKLVFLCPIWLIFVVLLVIFCVIFWIVSRIIANKRNQQFWEE